MLLVLPEGVHLRDCPAAGLDVYEESLHGSVRVVDRQVEVQLSKKKHIFASVADPGCLSRIPDPDFYPSRIPDPGSRIQKQQQKRGMKKNLLSYLFCSQNFTKLKINLFLKCLRKKFGPIFKELYFLLKKLSLCSQKYGFGIRDPRIPESKKAPDPGSATLIFAMFLCTGLN